MMEIKVKSCRDCPFKDSEYINPHLEWQNVCAFPTYPINDYITSQVKNHTIHEECPIKSNKQINIIYEEV